MDTIVKYIKDNFDTVRELSDKYTEQLFNNPAITRDKLADLLSNQEIKYLDWLFALRPSEVGINAQFVSLKEPTTELVFQTVNRTVKVPDKDKTYTHIILVPKTVWEAWTSLHKALTEQTGNQLELLSAYRSPAYQALLLSYYLSRNPENLSNVFKRVGLPGYSQHGDATNTAIDVATPDKASFENKFELTPQYHWMLDNAPKYGFHLSYPKANSEGFKFEPWHWRYKS